MADTERKEITFSGFDSAWGAHNSGAICDLVLNADGSLRLDRDPVVANWVVGKRLLGHALLIQ